MQRRCGWAPGWSENFRELAGAVRALDTLPDHIAEVRTRAVATAELLGQPVRKLSVERLGQISDLADLAFHAEHRPERDWLVRAGLDRAEQRAPGHGGRPGDLCAPAQSHP